MWCHVILTLIFLVASKPSSWFSNSNIVRWTSLSPPELPSILVDPIESISSMNMIEGACSLRGNKQECRHTGWNPLIIQMLKSDAALKIVLLSKMFWKSSFRRGHVAKKICLLRECTRLINKKNMYWINYDLVYPL